MTEKLMMELVKSGPAYIKAIAISWILIKMGNKISKSKSVDVSLNNLGHVKLDEEDNK